MAQARVLICLFAWLLMLPMTRVNGEDEPVFSGPQPGESLPSLQVLGIIEPDEGQSFDILAKSEGGPILIVFMHELTRPGFGLMRAITEYASEPEPKPMAVAVVFLTQDVSETIRWSKNVRQLFSPKVLYAVSPDGKEGPGAYGLNRNVTLTVLVADQGKVLANFALLQPQLQADGPGILKAIAKATGRSEIPSTEELERRVNPRMGMRRGGDAQPGD